MSSAKLSELFPPNRIAGLAAFLTGLAAAVLAITNTFPKNWQQTVVAISGLIGAFGAALHFMLGSQKMDQHASDQIVADKNLTAARIYAGHDVPVQAQADTNVTDVTGVTDDPEAPSEIDTDEVAIPEDLNSDQWLANRKIPASAIGEAKEPEEQPPAPPVLYDHEVPEDPVDISPGITEPS